MTVRRALGTPLPLLAREGVVRLALVVKARVHEARSTLAYEVGLFLTSVCAGLWLRIYPDAFKDGWGLFRGVVTQPQVGTVFLLDALVRLVVLVAGCPNGRQRVSLGSLVLYGTLFAAVWLGNRTSPVLIFAPMVLAGNAWIIGATEWGKADRRREARARA